MVLRDLGRALSLSTLCLTRVWTGLLDNPSNWPRRGNCWAVLINSRVKDALEVDGESSYIDNLRLVDRTMAELRRAMEATGTWDRTTVLVTSDHWWRHELWRQAGELAREEVPFASKVDHRVPFILKLAGQREAVTYEPAFNTVAIHDLILAILGGEVHDAADAIAWLDQHRSIGESPYHMGVTSAGNG